MPKVAAAQCAAAGVSRGLICSTMALISFGPSRSGPINHGQYGNIAALLAHNQCILGHDTPPFFSAARATVYWLSLQYDLQNASHAYDPRPIKL
jgi:hypothetical protein